MRTTFWRMGLVAVALTVVLIALRFSDLAAHLVSNVALSRLVRVMVVQATDDPWTSNTLPELVEVASYLDRWATRWPSNPALRATRLRVLWFYGRPDLAIDAGQQFPQMHRMSAITGYYLGWAYEQLGMTDQAVNIWRQTGVPSEAALRLRKTAYAQGDRDRLVRLVEIGVALEPRSPRSIMEAAGHYENWGLRSEAARLWRRRLSLAPPDDPEYWYALSEAARLDDQFDKAADMLAQAVERWPEDSRFLERWTYNLKSSGHWAEMATVAETWVARFPQDANAYYSVGEAYRYLEDYRRAGGWYSQAISVNPAHAPSLYQLGFLAHAQGQFIDAIEYYRKAVVADPNMSEAYFDMGMAYYTLGNVDKAIEQAELALAHFPEVWCPWGWYGQLGAWYLEQGKLEPARSAYEKAVACKPDFAEAIQALIELAELALAHSPEGWCPWGWYGQLGAWHLDQGRLEPARWAYEKAVACKPDFAEAIQALKELRESEP